jgi:pimeloyl-ACP methyl ester carboxylesterase
MNWCETEAELARAWAEEPVVIPSFDGDLIGIYTPAAPEVPPARMCVVLFARPRFEYRRMAVDLARRLSLAGFACFRFDFHGWGDSEGESSFTNIDDPALEDVTAVIRYLTEVREERHLVLWGWCYGARAAISVFVQNPDPIEGLAFLSAPLNAQPVSGVYNLSNLRRWLMDSEQWRQLILSRRARRRAANALRAMVRRSLAGRNWAESVSPVFEKHFRALVNARARALFLYGLEDDEYPLFRLAEPRLFGRLDAATRKRFEIVAWPGRVHSVLDVHRQQEIVAKSVSWISSLHPNPVHVPALSSGLISAPYRS